MEARAPVAQTSGVAEVRVLVACERTGTVRRAFRARGHEAWSCDLEPADDGSRWHHQRDALRVLEEEGPWDLMIAHPPCTHLSLSGNGSRKSKDPGVVREAVQFARELMLTRLVRKVCVENPMSILGSEVMPCTQVVEPWWFGDPVRKRTCLWLRGLERLRKSIVVEPWDDSIWRLGGSRRRGEIRSRTFPGMAEAMASQWG